MSFPRTVVAPAGNLANRPCRRRRGSASGRGRLAEVGRKLFAVSRVVVRAMDKKPQWRVRLDGDSASGVVVGALGTFHVDVA